MIDIVQKLMDEFNHHSGALADLLEGAASEIDCLRDEKADLAEKVSRLETEAYSNGELYNKEHLLRLSGHEDGQRAMQELVAKRLDALAAEQKSWGNHCAASVIKAEAAAVRSLSIMGHAPKGRIK